MTLTELSTADSAPGPASFRRGVVAFWHTYNQDWRAVLGLYLMLVAVLVALFAPYLAPFNPNAMSDHLLRPPSGAYWMGTDHLGRDIFSRVVWGARISLLFAVGAAAISLSIGVVMGAIPGYFGGIIDQIFSRFFEFFLIIPMLFLVILMASLLGANIYVAAFVVGITIWPSNARIVRAQVLSLKKRAFVRAARATGASHMRILFRHILMNGIQPVVVNSTLQVGSAILIEASLSFLGLGDPNLASWGQMLREAQSYLTTQWWFALFPGLAIGWLVLGSTLMGDGINRALNAAER
ncbi:MAG: peptide transporter [Firmicutes bacterium]|nr:peptide transporter [Bacillota bacterium]